MTAISLDKKDRDILYELSLNGRISLTQLAREVDLSKQVVSYRINQMEKKGVIRRYYTISNIYMLGKTHYRVFIKYQNISSDVEQEMQDFLIKHPQIAWVLNLDGDFDIFFVIWADNIIEFEAVYDEIIGKFGRYFLQKYFSIATRIEYLPFNFLNGDATSAKAMTKKTFTLGDCYSRYQLNDLDKKILTALNRNGRIYFSKLAKELKASSRVIKSRIRRLTKHGIITGFNVKVDHNLLGFTYQKVLLKLNTTARAELEKLSDFLRQEKSIIYLLKTIGTYDFEFELMTKSNDEFFDIIKRVRLEFAENINSYSTVVMSSEPKYEHLTL